MVRKLPHPPPSKIQVIDSHTGGEPTRVVVSGWPQPEGETMTERVDYLRQYHDDLRRAVVTEPRGHDAVVGALLTPPVNKKSITGVLFFNDVGYLGMCGHALIGTMVTLKHMGKIEVGTYSLDTPPGTVRASIDFLGRVELENVPSYLYQENITLAVPDYGNVTGDIAYGGNWFFLAYSVNEHLRMDNLEHLMSLSKFIRRELVDHGHRGPNGEIIDHVEFYSSPRNPKAHSRNFVLCPGNAYDRSPCGTGTSAKMASLYSKGKLKAGETWVQESITGSLYEGRIEIRDKKIIPFIRSTAHVTSENTLLFEERDPFCWSIGDGI